MGKIRLKGSSSGSAPCGRIKIESTSSTNKRKRSSAPPIEQPPPVVGMPMISTHTTGGRVSLMVTENKSKDSAVVHGTSPALEEALLVGQKGHENRSVPIGAHVLSFLKRRKGMGELEKALFDFGHQINEDLAKAEDAKTEGVQSETPMSPEAGDSFVDATVVEEQARKKRNLDPCEVDAVFTRADPHTVQSSLQAGKLKRITQLGGNEMMHGKTATFPQWFDPTIISQTELDCLRRIFGVDGVNEEGIAKYLKTRSEILDGKAVASTEYNVAVYSLLRHLAVIGGNLRDANCDDNKKRSPEHCWCCHKYIPKTTTAYAVTIPSLSGHGKVLTVCRHCAVVGNIPDCSKLTRLDGMPIRPPTEEEVVKIGAALAERSAAGVVVLADELKRTPEECLVIAARESFEKFDITHSEDFLTGVDNPLMRLLGLLCAIVHPVVASSGAKAVLENLGKKSENLKFSDGEILRECMRGAKIKAEEISSNLKAIDRRLCDVLENRVKLYEQRVAWSEALDTALVSEARVDQGVSQSRINVLRLEKEMKNAMMKRNTEEFEEKKE